ncbi:DUF3526 domain-containing protein [Dyadobacter sp. 32]|uniref:DUF3526 domain-containing protein n=1 Tax=Dyadobacter sp. 32 TaxID=538966 RepID=UPI0039C71409
MSMLAHVFYYEWLSFIRNKFQIVMLLLVFLLGSYSIFYGCSEIAKQKKAIVSVHQQDKQERARIQQGFKADTTTADGKRLWQLAAVTRFVWHRQFYAAVFPPSALSALSLGQRDIQTYYYKLTAMSIYYQLFQNEIANPQKLLIGNFDLSFVFVYLFPLLIIAFCYSLLSADKDRGLLALLKSQAAPVHRIIIYRLLFYFLIIFALALLLSFAGFAASGIRPGPDLRNIIAWLAVVTAYLVFWFAILFIIIALNKNSSFNAMAGMGAWLTFLIIIPAVLNILISVAMPLNTSVLSGISRRTGVFDEENDENQKKVIREYLKQRPELDFGSKTYKSDLITKGFAAYTELNDQKSAEMVRRYQNQVQVREGLARHIDFINPAVNAQNMFDAIAGSDLQSFQQFYHAVKNFHAQLVSFYYPKLFADNNLTQNDFSKAPQFRFMQASADRTSIFPGILWLAGISLISILWSFKMLKKDL